jgi:hypothetical protein
MKRVWSPAYVIHCRQNTFGSLMWKRWSHRKDRELLDLLEKPILMNIAPSPYPHFKWVYREHKNGARKLGKCCALFLSLPTTFFTLPQSTRIIIWAGWHCRTLSRLQLPVCTGFRTKHNYRTWPQEQFLCVFSWLLPLEGGKVKKVSEDSPPGVLQTLLWYFSYKWVNKINSHCSPIFFSF